jgi:two-component system response regulator AtoC
MTTPPPDGNRFVYGVSAAARSLERMLADIAPTDIPVLLVGGSGTGKEALAQEIHRLSRRHKETFLRCNCAGVTAESLLAHLATGQNNGGENALANGGTVFLDEVDQLDLTSQTRLLHLLPDGDRLPPGRALGARVISAATGNLAEALRAGSFREELYYRLNGVCLRLPLLSQRKEDIPALADFFLRKYAALFDRPVLQLDPKAMNLLLQYSWPGNVRELENVARKIMALGDAQLALSDLMTGTTPVAAEPAARPVAARKGSNGRSLKESAREASRKVEREMILNTLERTRWNRKRSALELQISYKALLYKMKLLGLNGSVDSERQPRDVR